MEAFEAKVGVPVMHFEMIGSLMLKLVDLTLHEFGSNITGTDLLAVLDTRDERVTLKKSLKLILVDLFNVFSAEVLFDSAFHLVTSFDCFRRHVKVFVLNLFSKQMLVEVSNTIGESNFRNVDHGNFVII